MIVSTFGSIVYLFIYYRSFYLSKMVLFERGPAAVKTNASELEPSSCRPTSRAPWHSSPSSRRRPPARPYNNHTHNNNNDNNNENTNNHSISSCSMIICISIV